MLQLPLFPPSLRIHTEETAGRSASCVRAASSFSVRWSTTFVLTPRTDTY